MAPTSISDGFAGKHVLLTGATGFVGMAVLERILASLPATRVTLLLRPQFGRPASSRLDRLHGASVFGPLRERHKLEWLQATAKRRVQVLECDLSSQVPTVSDDVDVVIHCPASLSFDAPIHVAAEINVRGVQHLLEGIVRSASHPHVVHVSTAYVSGLGGGIAAEERLTHRLDWRVEVAAAATAQHDAEAASRTPDVLSRLLKAVQAEHAKAGAVAVSRVVEERRETWVQQRLVEYGRTRARALGWPDVYTLTKALGERVAEDFGAAGGLSLSIVRPSIIESALAQPYSGWIEGFKMCEPAVLAYGRGQVSIFPGVPDGVFDVVPVDFVVNALLAVAVSPPPTTTPGYYHVCSGASNPLTFRQFCNFLHTYFQDNPLSTPNRGGVAVSTPRTPGAERVDRALRLGERLLDLTDAVLANVPVTSLVRRETHRAEAARQRLVHMRRLTDLFGPYTEAEVLFLDDNVRRLRGSLPRLEQDAFPFDVSAYEWRHYWLNVHLPAIARDAPLPRADRSIRTRQVKHIAPGGAAVAIFDMEGTLADSNVVEMFVWLTLTAGNRRTWPAQLAALALRLPFDLRTERRNRSEFLRRFYRHYRGRRVDQVRHLAESHVHSLVMRRLSPNGIRRVRQHRAAGHRTVLISGGLDVFLRPLVPLFDEIVAASLAVESDVCTGDLNSPPLVGEARAAWLRAYAQQTGADLQQSYAYADSYSDLPLLRAVANPVVVNPDVALLRFAIRRHWPTEEWNSAPGTPRLLLPKTME